MVLWKALRDRHMLSCQQQPPTRNPSAKSPTLDEQFAAFHDIPYAEPRMVWSRSSWRKQTFTYNLQYFKSPMLNHQHFRMIRNISSFYTFWTTKACEQYATLTVHRCLLVAQAPSPFKSHQVGLVDGWRWTEILNLLFHLSAAKLGRMTGRILSDFDTYLIRVDSEENLHRSHEAYCMECQNRRFGVIEPPDFFNLEIPNRGQRDIQQQRCSRQEEHHESSVEELYQVGNSGNSGMILGFALSQRDTVLLCNNVSHWLGTSLESGLELVLSQAKYRVGNWKLFCIKEMLANWARIM